MNAIFGSIDWARVWRIAVALTGTLILCACRGNNAPPLPEILPGGGTAAVADAPYGAVAGGNPAQPNPQGMAQQVMAQPGMAQHGMAPHTQTPQTVVPVAYHEGQPGVQPPHGRPQEGQPDYAQVAHLGHRRHGGHGFHGPASHGGPGMHGPAVHGYPGQPFGGPMALPPASPQWTPPPFPDAAYLPQWEPLGLHGPFPDDEYLRDGGDRGLPARVQHDWVVQGLETEDTIAHYDTLDGATHVAPSNQVHIYAPRFAAVRSVTAPHLSELRESTGHYHLPEGVVGRGQTLEPAGAVKHVQVHQQLGEKHVTIAHTRQGDGVMSRALSPTAFDNRLLPFENNALIRYGIERIAEKAMLAISMQSAVTWSHDLGVQVTVNGQQAGAVTGDQRAQATLTYDTIRGPVKLRVVKVASTSAAEPGETVDFTIRFDNIGTQVVGNVTIMDNLTTRLEYLEGSAQASVAADFLTQANAEGSQVLRWEITDPVEPGQGGVVRFRCRVR